MTDTRPSQPNDTTDDLERLDRRGGEWQVQLRADGQLTSSDPTIIALLQHRLQRAELLHTDPGWTVLRSLHPSAHEPGLGDAHRVVVAGSMSEDGLSLIDFIGFLASGCQSGVLTVADLDAQRSIYLHDGDVVWASSTAVEDRLGEFLVRRGKITREQLQTAIRHGGSPIGQACVDCGFIAAHELWSMVQAQLLDIFDNMLRAETGTWSFARISGAALAESRIHLSTQGLLMDALRRLDEMKVFRQRISSQATLVRRGAEVSESADLTARAQETADDEAASLLRQLPRSATIAELMRLLGRSEYQVTSLVYRLIQQGLVEVSNPEPGAMTPRRAEQVSRSKAKDVIDVYAMALREMTQELGNSPRRTALIDAVRAFVDDPSHAMSHVLREVAISNRGELEAAPLLLAATEQGVGIQELSDALSELLFFVLFQATDLLGHRKGDNLARRVKIILDLLSKDDDG